MDDRSLPAHTKATVGMRVTKEVGTDSYAGVCTAIDRDGKRATFTVGKRKYQCSLRSDGRYREVGRSSKGLCADGQIRGSIPRGRAEE